MVPKYCQSVKDSLQLESLVQGFLLALQALSRIPLRPPSHFTFWAMGYEKRGSLVLINCHDAIAAWCHTATVVKIVAQNRHARYDYEILDTVEAGLLLTGQEVKSCRNGNANLAGSYVSFLHGKPVLKGIKIAAYKFASGLEDYDPGRDRSLLLSKADVQRLQSASDGKGMTIIPLEVRAGKYIKVLLGLGKGKSRYDKRQKIREKEVKQKLHRGEDY